MSSNKNLENIFKEAFEGFSVNPSNSLWTKISRNLILKDFFTFNPRKFNFYYSMIIVVATSLIIYNLNQNSNKSKLYQIAENHKDISNFAQDSNNIIVLDSGTNDDIDNNETNNSKLNIKENNTETETELHDNTVKTVYIAEEESNSEEIKNVKLADKPYAEFSASNYTACEPVAITFINESENCDSYLWDFGNGKTSSLKNPTFVFRAAGTFTVKLTVFSGSHSNSSSSASKKIVVNKKPDASFYLKNKVNLFTNDRVQYINSSSDYNTSIWNFGDGNTSDNTHPRHEYETPGSYRISLICKTENNCADTSILEGLQIKDNKYRITAPTGLYENTDFFPIFNYTVAEYRLTIYTRFGTKIFESNDPDIGWDGYYNGTLPSDITVFVWKCSGKFVDGETFQKTGNFTFYPIK